MSDDHRPLHATDRRLDLAFDALAACTPDTFLHCLHGQAGATDVPPLLRERLPMGRWIASTDHPLQLVDPSDHLQLHRAWLEACHGADRVARATVRTSRPLATAERATIVPVGRYDLEIIDLVGTPEIDAVVIALTASAAEEPHGPAAPPPRGSPSFRLRLDLEGTIVGGTTTVRALLGRSLADLVGTAVGPLIHPDDFDAAAGVWEDVLDHPDESQTVRLRLQLGDGTWRWFSDTAWNALDDPEAPGIISEFHDIAALVEAEQALHASELGFRTLAESLPVGVALLDEDGRVHFANHRLVSLLIDADLAGPGSGSPTAAPTGAGYVTTWTELVDPQLTAEVADLLRPGDPAAPAPVSRQVQLRRGDGEPVHLLIQAVTIRNPDGRSVIVSLQDVTEGVQAARAHTRLAQVMDQVDDAVVLVDARGRISYVNDAAHALFGQSAVGRPIKDQMASEALAFAEAVIEPGIGGMQRWRGDMDVVALDGRRLILDTTVNPVIDPDGGEVHVGVTMRDVTAARAHERALDHQARHDALTGLPNRLAVTEMLERALAASGGRDVAVFFIDLDNLKIVNDGVGHSAGDRLLEAVAAELRRAADGATVARFGGDEFVVVCEGLPPDAALGRAAELLEAVRSAEVDGVAAHVSASIGVATSRRPGVDGETLIRDADAAMYEAKHGGRGRCAIFDGALRARVSRRFELESELRRTIEDGGLDLHFQPIVSLADGAVTGLEALCRWGAVSPGEFIPIAEESGLVRQLGHRVLLDALAGARRIHAAAPELAGVRIGVNVSARELDHADYAPRTLAAIEASGVPIDQVVLELTESALIDPRDEVAATLRTLRDAGIVLALDDFGSGYSSLAYLRRYPLDVLKLDISYTQGMVDDPETRVIVEAVVTMANRLGLRVVAEGIETPDQLALVGELGVSWAQGFLVGRPAPLGQLLASQLAPAAVSRRPE